MTFTEAVAATQARLDHRVKVSIEEQGRTRRIVKGVLKRGYVDRGPDGPIEVIPAEEPEGRMTFRVSPHFHWFSLDPRVFTDAQEQRDGRLLRVEMGKTTVVIETLA